MTVSEISHLFENVSFENFKPCIGPAFVLITFLLGCVIFQHSNYSSKLKCAAHLGVSGCGGRVSRRTRLMWVELCLRWCKESVTSLRSPEFTTDAGTCIAPRHPVALQGLKEPISAARGLSSWIPSHIIFELNFICERNVKPLSSGLSGELFTPVESTFFLFYFFIGAAVSHEKRHNIE